MIKILKYTISIFLLLFIATAAYTQDYSLSRGIPFIRNYAPEEYNAHEKNYEIMQGDSGEMYFANFAGLLQFDGVRWEKIVSESGMRILSINKSSSGKIFASGLYDFGYLSTNDLGQTQFISIVPKDFTPEDIGLVFKTIPHDDKLLFISEDRIFTYKNNKLKTTEAEGKILSAFKVGKELYIFYDTRDTKASHTGLYKLNNDDFEKIQSSDGLRILGIRFMINAINDNSIIIGSENQGLFLLKNNMLTELPGDVNNFLKANRVTSGIRISSKNYAIGTATDGIVIINNEGTIIQHIHQNSKLQDESINSLYVDENKSLWATTNNGISKIEINWPLSYIDNRTSGLSGKVQTIESHSNKLYFGTEDGLFYLESSNIKKIDNKGVACLDLLNISNNLLAASSRGIFMIKGGKMQLSSDKNFTYCLTKSVKNDNVFYAGQSSQLSFYQAFQENIKLVKTIKNIPGDVINIEEDKLGNIFLEVSPGKTFVLKNNSSTATELKMNEDAFLSLHLNKVNEEVFFSSEKGLFKANKDLNSFEPYRLIGKDKSSGKLWIYDLFELSTTTYLVTNGEQKELSFISNVNDKLVQNQTPFLPVRSFSIQTLWMNPQKTQLWAGGKDGLIMANIKSLYDYNSQFKTGIRKVSLIGKDSLLSITHDEKHKISYLDNSIKFEFSLPTFPVKGDVEYRYFLNGFDKDTSSWSRATEKEYTNLPAGDYTFIVEARNEFGKTAPHSSFTFFIPTPIYRQWWTFIIYIAILAVLIRLIVKWRMRASEKEKERLEGLVKERTEEIELSKKKIEEQRDIAYKHRKEILDSISYAQKIQQAVLPSSQVVDDLLMEYFIFYKPRDIVSGDFYWMKKLNNYVAVVAADCTGHGVPGAFMSMLGSSFLNEIVTRRSLDSAAQILNRLRAKVKKSLHQEGKEGEQKDGMDIALLIIDNESLELQYSGAYNPLYIIRPKAGVNILDEEIDVDSRFELIHLKADRQPIGIHLAEKEFTNHVFQLEKGDSLYSFSDGFVDQFGGETGEKFKTKRFKELLMSVQSKPMTEQKQALEQAFMKWKRDLAQIDDVLVMGIKV